MAATDYSPRALTPEAKGAIIFAATETARSDAGVPLDLSEEGVDQFLLDIGARAARVIQGIENAEPWTVDRDPTITDAIEQFCIDLSSNELKRLAELPDRSLLVVLGFIRAARSLLFIDRLAEAAGDEGAPADAFFKRMSRVAAAGDDATQAFHICHERLVHLERTRCIGRVYGLGRARRILAALGEYRV